MLSLRRLLSWLPVVALLAGCDDYRAESTRREIYKLAFRTAQFHEALERCEADPKTLEKHEKVWKENFDAAVPWLEMERADITARQDAGRQGLSEDAELGCPIVLKATKISFAAADRWATRIADEEYCGIMDCE
jgi:hypothetical protein